MKNPKLKFPPGSEWLYIRIYGGPQALEEWITGPFMGLLSAWRHQELIRLFYFVHYLDPEYQLRLRFNLSDPLHAGILMNQIRNSCNIMLDEDLVWKIEAGTYEPEYDRYGTDRMSLCEGWFEIDSMYWLAEISRRSPDQDIWKSALRSVDWILEDFRAMPADKINIIRRLSISTSSIYRLKKTMRGQLDSKYRKMSGELLSALNRSNEPPDALLVTRSDSNSSIVMRLFETFSDPTALIESDLILDLIHMSLNRAFRTRHRLQELVLYDFLLRHYESVEKRGNNQNSQSERHDSF